MNPAAARARVDLPAPVRPAIPTRSPGRDARQTPSSAVLAPTRDSGRKVRRCRAARRPVALVASLGHRGRTPSADQDDDHRRDHDERRAATGRSADPRPSDRPSAPGRAPNPRASSANVRSRASTSEPSSTGPMSGTSDRIRRTNEPSSDSPRACCASRIAPRPASASAARAGPPTGRRTRSDGSRPREMSDSSMSSASVVNRNVTDARNATRTRPAEIEPERQPLTRDRERPERHQHVLRCREEQAVDDDDREQQDGRDAHRPDAAARAARPTRPRRAMATREDGRTSGGRRNAASSTRPSARSLVSGLRRWSQLEPATK